MNANETPRFTQLIAMLAESFQKSPSEMTFASYRMGLDDLPLPAVESAVRRAMLEKKFFPSVAELRELAGELTPADRAVIAWQAMLGAHAMHGYYGSVDFDDKAINAAVHALGGWERFAERLEDEGRVWIGKEFDRVYQVYARRGVSRMESLPLGGYHSRMNGANGHREHIPTPQLIATGLRPTLLLDGHGDRAAIEDKSINQAIAAIGRMP